MSKEETSGIDACGPTTSIMQRAAIVLEDATKDNAYHPTGPVLDNTIVVIDEETKALPASREEQ